MEKLLARHDWNLVQGCTKVSEGCKNCYAEQYLGPKFFNVVVQEELLDVLPTLRRGADITVAECGDLFHESVNDAFILRAINVISNNPSQRFVCLTKRPERFEALFSGKVLPANLLLGVSVESQQEADARIPLLSVIEGAKRLVSAQPLLGPVILPDVHFDWLCAGSEWGKNARPLDEDWVRGLRDQCAARGIPMAYQQNVVNGRRKLFPLLDKKPVMGFLAFHFSKNEPKQ